MLLFVTARPSQPLRHSPMMRARARSTSEAERPVSTLCGSPGWRLTIGRPRGGRHPLPLRIDVSTTLCSGLRRLRGEELLQHIAGELRDRDAAPTLGTLVQPHRRPLAQQRECSSRGRWLFAQPDRSGRVSECVLGGWCALSAERGRAAYAGPCRSASPRNRISPPASAAHAWGRGAALFLS